MESISSWTQSEVASFFESINLGKYVTKLQEEEVDGGMLQYMLENGGLDELGMSKIHQAKLNQRLKCSRGGTDPPGQTQPTQPTKQVDAGAEVQIQLEAYPSRQQGPSECTVQSSVAPVMAERLSIDSTPTVCLLGMTGAGKSSTGNSLLGCQSDNTFATGHKGSSLTTQTASVTGAWRGAGPSVQVIDTPGWLDSKGRDADDKHRREMERALKELEKVHAFMVVLKAQDRFHGGVISMLKLLRNLFGKAFLRHLVFAFTGWDYDGVSKEERELQNGQKDDSLLQMEKATELNFLIEELFNMKSISCPCVFLDNRVNFMLSSKRYGSERGQVVNELDAQLQVVWNFMCSTKPFDCQGISVLRAERAQEVHNTVPHYLRLDPSHDSAHLGRQLQSGDQDVLYSGWLWWRRIWIYGKLCRGSLFFYESDASNAPRCTMPEKIELLNCVCSPRGKFPLSKQRFYFTLDRHAQSAADVPDLTASSSFRFGVNSEEEQRRWVWTIMDATQISDGCRRVESLHDALANAESLEQYLSAIFRVEGQTIVVPVEWMWRCSHSEVVARTMQEVNKGPDLKQLDADFGREDISIDGSDTPLHNPSKGEVLERIALQILDEDETADSPNRLASAMALARDALFGCSRTHGGSLSMGAVETLFQNMRFVEIYHDTEYRCSKCLTAIKRKCLGCGSGMEVPGECEKCGEKITQCKQCGEKLEKQVIDVRMLHNKEKLEALQHVDNNIGVCHIEGTDDTSLIGVRLNLQSNVQIHLQEAAAEKDSWIEDDEFIQCMICRLPFSNFMRRRHHCRLCGKLVCWICSQHRILLDGKLERVDFVCYAHSYAKVLHEAKSAAVSQLQDVDSFIRRPRSESEGAKSEGAKARAESEAYAHSESAKSEGATSRGPKSEGADSESAKSQGAKSPRGVNSWGAESSADPGSNDGANSDDDDEECLSASMGGAADDSPQTPNHSAPPNKHTGGSAFLPQTASDDANGKEQELPCISVTMDQMFKAVDTDCNVLFFLNCKYFRLVRWSGCEDQGRIFLSIEFNPTHPIVSQLRAQRQRRGGALDEG